MKPRPTFNEGEQLSAQKLNELGMGMDAARVNPGPGVRGGQDAEGTVIGEARYRRITIGKTGGASYPATAANILTEYPFQFVDIDPDKGIGTAVLERDGEYVVRNMLGEHIPEDTLVELIEHRGEWWTSYGGTGGGTLSIYFQIAAVVCPLVGERYIQVEPQRVAPPCTATLPEYDSYTGLIDVYDNGFRCILPEYTEEDLLGDNPPTTGLRGKATYSSPWPVDQYCSTEKTWTLDGLCNVYGCDI